MDCIHLHACTPVLAPSWHKSGINPDRSIPGFWTSQLRKSAAATLERRRHRRDYRDFLISPSASGFVAELKIHSHTTNPLPFKLAVVASGIVSGKARMSKSLARVMAT